MSTTNPSNKTSADQSASKRHKSMFRSSIDDFLVSQRKNSEEFRKSTDDAMNQFRTSINDNLKKSQKSLKDTITNFQTSMRDIAKGDFDKKQSEGSSFKQNPQSKTDKSIARDSAKLKNNLLILFLGYMAFALVFLDIFMLSGDSSYDTKVEMIKAGYAAEDEK